MMTRRLKDLKVKTDKMKEVVLQKRAHSTLGSELIGFVRKEVDKYEHGKQTIKSLTRKATIEPSLTRTLSKQISMEQSTLQATASSILDLIHIDHGLSQHVKDFLGSVQSIMSTQNQEAELAKIILQDELRDQVPQFEKYYRLTQAVWVRL